MIKNVWDQKKLKEYTKKKNRFFKYKENQLNGEKNDFGIHLTT